MLRSTHWDFASDFSVVFVISPQITRVVFGWFLCFKTCEVWPWHRFARRFLPQQWPLSWRQGALWDKLYKGSTSSAEGCLADMDMYIHFFLSEKTSVSIDIRDYRCFFFQLCFFHMTSLTVPNMLFRTVMEKNISGSKMCRLSAVWLWP